MLQKPDFAFRAAKSLDGSIVLAESMAGRSQKVGRYLILEDWSSSYCEGVNTVWFVLAGKNMTKAVGNGAVLWKNITLS
jgi:hypothetical protein